MKDFLENLAEINGWGFDYGRQDFLNLFDGTHDEKIHIACDPIKIDRTYTPAGTVESVSNTCSFLIGLSSDYDEENYKYRYDNYIKPLLDEKLKIIENGVRCSGNMEIVSLGSIEVVNSNLFDFNFDGLLINCVIKIY
ncbi:hypothetical protein Phi46:1_gp17 [Cellulophaga phage phi46:1]|uniref:hypothetical protein n=1 Tax=Cellulophaga phage phi46:1 TaxID=1327974 RepID=UPI0003515B3D|nr:hypothetical protein Phi46:1_gp17 [Cellulophaga phage phi46:1]AGO47828.1 hypothetical protein Phi46:1_gp17 [Cellulophaga phage phi46:1]